MNAQSIKAPSPSALLLESLINSSPMSQKEIADKLGYEKPNFITMLKQGGTRIPIVKVGRIAKIFNIDPSSLLNMVMSEYRADEWEIIREIMGDPISRYERKILADIKSIVSEEEMEFNFAKYSRLIREALEQDRLTTKAL